MEEGLTLYEDDSGNLKQVYDSEMGLTANVRSVQSDMDFNTVNLHITATGAYRWTEDSHLSPNNPEFRQFAGHVGTIQSLIEAEIVNYEGDVIYEPELYVKKTRNSANNFTTGPVGGTYEPTHWQKVAGEAALFGAQMYIDPKTLGGLSAAQFIWDHLEGTGSADLPEDKNGDIGTDAEVRQTWEHERIWPSDMDIPEERAHAVSTYIELDFPMDELDDLPDEAKLEVSAKNILGTTENADGEIIYGPVDGAEATVEIPIKNAEPEIEEEMNTDKNSYEASDYSSSVYPDLEDLTVENPAGCTDVDYEVEIEWDGEWDYDTHTAYTWITHEEEIDKTLNIAGIPEDGEWHEVEIMYSIKAHDRYGGWEEDLDPIEIEVKNEEDQDSGYPTPPPGGPIPVGEDYPTSEDF